MQKKSKTTSCENASKIILEHHSLCLGTPAVSDIFFESLVSKFQAVQGNITQLPNGQEPIHAVWASDGFERRNSLEVFIASALHAVVAVHEGLRCPTAGDVEDFQAFQPLNMVE